MFACKFVVRTKVKPEYLRKFCSSTSLRENLFRHASFFDLIGHKPAKIVKTKIPTFVMGTLPNEFVKHFHLKRLRKFLLQHNEQVDHIDGSKVQVLKKK